MHKIKKIFLAIIVTIAYLTFMKTLLNKYVADIYFMQSESLLSKANYIESLDLINKSIKKSPNEPIYFRHRAKVYLASSVTLENEEQKAIKQKSLDDIIKSQILNNKNLATLRNNISTYFFLANKDLTKQESQDNLDEDFFPIAKSYFDFLTKTYSNDVGTLISVAKYQKRLGLESDYNAVIGRIKDLRPDLLEWHPDLINK